MGEHSLIEKLMDTKERQQSQLRLKIVGLVYFVYTPLFVNSLRTYRELYKYSIYNANNTIYTIYNAFSIRFKRIA